MPHRGQVDLWFHDDRFFEIIIDFNHKNGLGLSWINQRNNSSDFVTLGQIEKFPSVPVKKWCNWIEFKNNNHVAFYAKLFGSLCVFMLAYCF